MPVFISLRTQCASLVGSVVLASSAVPAIAISINEVPNPRQTNGGWVTDMANLLSAPTETRLNQMISELEAENGTEIAVVTVPETAPAASPKAFATELFNTWGIGKREQNNGVLFLISKQDRRVEIDIGYGIEAILPNADVQRLIDRKILPQFKQGDFNQGTLDGTAALITALQSEGAASMSAIEPSAPAQSSSPLPLLIGGASLLAISGLIYRFTRGTRLQPGGRSRTQRQNYSDEQTGRQPRCAHCRQPMQKVPASELMAHLTEVEQVTQKLGSIKYLGWKCSANCQQSDAVHVRAYLWNETAYRTCPHCQDLTMTFALDIIEEATRANPGRQTVTETCECCDHHREYEESISRLPSPSHAHAGGAAASTTFVGGGYTGGGSGGGFGGGASGGGGAGGSW